MVRYTVFLDWKKQYCQNDYTVQAIYRFDEIPIKLPMEFFTELEFKNLNLCETQKTSKSQTILRKKKRARGNRLPDIRLYHKVTVLKTV